METWKCLTIYQINAHEAFYLAYNAYNLVFPLTNWFLIIRLSKAFKLRIKQDLNDNSLFLFFDRELCSKVLKEALLLFLLLLAWNHSDMNKTFPNGTKHVRNQRAPMGTKTLQRKQKNVLKRTLWPCFAFCFCNLALSGMAFYGLIWPFNVLMAFFGKILIWLDLYRIDPNSFVLVFICIIWHIYQEFLNAMNCFPFYFRSDIDEEQLFIILFR